MKINLLISLKFASMLSRLALWSPLKWTAYFLLALFKSLPLRQVSLLSVIVTDHNQWKASSLIVTRYYISCVHTCKKISLWYIKLRNIVKTDVKNATFQNIRCWFPFCHSIKHKRLSNEFHEVKTNDPLQSRIVTLSLENVSWRVDSLKFGNNIASSVSLKMQLSIKS